MFNNKQELLAKIRLSEDSLLELKEVRLKGHRVVDPNRNSVADELAAFANAYGGVCPLDVQDKSRNAKDAGIRRPQPTIRWRKGGGKKPFKDESRSQFQYRNEPERRAMYRAWGRVGNWLRWWAMMPLALSDGKSSEGRAAADEGLGGGLAVRRVDWATQRFPQPFHGRGPPKHESGCGKAVENAGSVVSRRVGRSGVMPRSAMRRRRFGTACRARG